MEFDATEFIGKNKPLYDFCRKIWSYKLALESDERYYFLSSLISSDYIVDKESCKKSLNAISFILKNMELFDLEDFIKKDTISYLRSAKKILKSDIVGFE